MSSIPPVWRSESSEIHPESIAHVAPGSTGSAEAAECFQESWLRPWSIVWQRWPDLKQPRRAQNGNQVENFADHRRDKQLPSRDCHCLSHQHRQSYWLKPPEGLAMTEREKLRREGADVRRKLRNLIRVKFRILTIPFIQLSAKTWKWCTKVLSF